MFKGNIQIRLINKYTKKVTEVAVQNQVVDELFNKICMYRGRSHSANRFDLNNLHVWLGLDSSNEVPENEPRLVYNDINSYLTRAKYVGKTVINNYMYEYKCVYPDTAFTPPSSDTDYNLIALTKRWYKAGSGNTYTLLAYKKLSSTITQTTEDHLEIIYGLKQEI